MSCFSVKFICKFQLLKDYRSIFPKQRTDLIKECIDIARKKNTFASGKPSIEVELFRELKSEKDGKAGMLEVHSGVIVFKGIAGSDGNSQKIFEHHIKDIAMVCQSHPDKLYFGYISLEAYGGTSFYTYFSNTQAEAVYKCISKCFKKISSSAEHTNDEEINYVSMSAKLSNVYSIDSKDRLSREQASSRSCDYNFNKNITVNNNYDRSNNKRHERQNSIISNISDFNWYGDSRKSGKPSGLSNVAINTTENGNMFSLQNPPIDDGDVGDAMKRNTYVIEISNCITHLEIITFLKQKYDVNILCNSIFVERKRRCGPYEEID